MARRRCGALSATCRGEPVRVSVCHCRACQRRTGGTFSAQRRFPEAAVTIAGAFNFRECVADSGRCAAYCWCPACGATIAYTNEGIEGLIAIPLGAFVDNRADALPTPHFSVWEDRRQPGVEIVGERIAHEA